MKAVVQAQVISNSSLGKLVQELKFHAPEIAEDAYAGQFVHLRVLNSSDPLLRRPFSIAGVDRQAGLVTIIYRVIGRGTLVLSTAKPGDQLDCMGPLGSGFVIEGERPLLVGGGMGLAPLAFLAEQLCPRPVEVLMGGRTAVEMFWTDYFKGICQGIHITTDDGSMGYHGFAPQILPQILAEKSYDRIYACGPRPMLQGVSELALQAGIPCQISLEAFMACGVGACLSCSCNATDGSRRKVCTDGPVFWAGEVSTSC
jgi:dihydroorotate dehydrogenase electron transfer subunit